MNGLIVLALVVALLWMGRGAIASFLQKHE